jgi:uncharacterized protein YabE (DUF348 family)/3D (Asp-Asp-Asp) domain-containing protein
MEKLKMLFPSKDHKYSLYITIIFIIAIIAIGFYLYLIRSKQVIVFIDNKEYKWFVFGNTVAEVLKEKGISLKNEDKVNPALKRKVFNNTKIHISRAFPMIVKHYNQTIKFNTTSQTVQDFLTDVRIILSKNDRVSPALNKIIKPGQLITISRVTSQIIAERSVLSPKIEYRLDQKTKRSLPFVQQAGQNGILELQTKIVYQEGREISRITLRQKIIKPTINTIMLVGLKPISGVLVTSKKIYKYLDLLLMEATAYYPGPECTGKYSSKGLTYTGKKARYGLVAVDPRVISLGTMLYIEGYGKAEAADVGGAIKGNKIDLCFATYYQAKKFGRQIRKVYILDSSK